MSWNLGLYAWSSALSITLCSYPSSLRDSKQAGANSNHYGNQNFMLWLKVQSFMGHNDVVNVNKRPWWARVKNCGDPTKK